jgi:hypothetical protein
MKRRKFLGMAAAGLPAFYIVPRHVLGKGYTAPSDKLNIAGIGIGGKGIFNLNMAFKGGDSEIVALCDVETGHARPTSAISAICWTRRAKISTR